MEGIRLIPGPGFQRGVARAAGTSTFDTFFLPLREIMRRLHWWADYSESTPFFTRMTMTNREADFEASVIDLPSRAPNDGLGTELLFRAGTLPDFAPFLGDDWIDLIGIDAAKHDPLDVATWFRDHPRIDAASTRTYCDRIERWCELCFYCMDGAYWDLYAKNPENIRAVEAHAKSNPAIIIRRRTWEEHVRFVCDVEG